MHSGSFLGNPTGFGKDTMQRKKRTYQTVIQRNGRVGLRCIVYPAGVLFTLFLCVISSGCTRREQLVLESDATLQEEERQVAEKTAGEADTQIEAVLPAQTGTAPVYQDVTADGAQDAEQRIVAEQEPQKIFVHVCGAVEKPGVYELQEGSRVYEAVEKAGGFTEDADSSYVNQAQRLADGTKLVIPTTEQVEEALETKAEADIGIVEQAQEGQGTADDVVTGQTEGVQDAVSDTAGAGGTYGETADGRVNINTASEDELCSIPGIGSTRAAAIVAYRQENGGFRKLEDIMNVSGIKEGTYNKIKDKIKVY